MDRLNAQGMGTANMLHFSRLEPFPPGAEAALQRARKRVVVEGNSTGQLELLIRMRTGMTMDGAVRRFDGRPFRPQYILDNLKEVR